VVVIIACTVETTNPAVDTFVLYENCYVISNKTVSGVSIKTLDTGSKVTYKSRHTIGTTGSNNVTFIVEVETTKVSFFRKMSIIIIL